MDSSDNILEMPLDISKQAVFEICKHNLVKKKTIGPQPGFGGGGAKRFRTRVQLKIFSFSCAVSYP